MAELLPADERCEHEYAMAALVDRYQQWRSYECPYCEVEQLKLDLAQQAINASTIIEMQKELGKLQSENERLSGLVSGLHRIAGAAFEALGAMRALAVAIPNPCDDGLRLVECPECHGVGGGRLANGDEIDCSTCNGEGGVLRPAPDVTGES